MATEITGVRHHRSIETAHNIRKQILLMWWHPRDSISVKIEEQLVTNLAPPAKLANHSIRSVKVTRAVSHHKLLVVHKSVHRLHLRLTRLLRQDRSRCSPILFATPLSPATELIIDNNKRPSPTWPTTTDNTSSTRTTTLYIAKSEPHHEALCNTYLEAL